MTRRRLPAAALGLALAALAPCWVSAAPGDDSEPGARPEPEVGLPAYPKEQDLFLIEETRAGMRYSVDTASIAIGEDRIVRYTAVVSTPGGAVNVTHEGLDCISIRKRVYAVGQKGGTWSRARESGWSPIQNGRQDHHRFLLYDQYFCALNLPVKTPDEARTSLRQGGTADYRANRVRGQTF